MSIAEHDCAYCGAVAGDRHAPTCVDAPNKPSRRQMDCQRECSESAAYVAACARFAGDQDRLLKALGSETVAEAIAEAARLSALAYRQMQEIEQLKTRLAEWGCWREEATKLRAEVERLERGHETYKYGAEAVINGLQKRAEQAEALLDKATEALEAYLKARPQCECTDARSCEMAAARVLALAALSPPPPPEQPADGGGR